MMCRWVIGLGALVWSAAALQYASAAEPPAVPPYPHSQVIRETGPEQADYLLGLGALQKIGGRWRHKDSEVVPGELWRTTWQVNEPYTAVEAYEWLVTRLPGEPEALYECRGRSCGSSAQWADRVFSERLLYGHDERQRYGAFRGIEGETRYVFVIYAVDRANRRHYVHLDVLRETP